MPCSTETWLPFVCTLLLFEQIFLWPVLSIPLPVFYAPASPHRTPANCNNTRRILGEAIAFAQNAKISLRRLRWASNSLKEYCKQTLFLGNISRSFKSNLLKLDVPLRPQQILNDKLYYYLKKKLEQLSQSYRLSDCNKKKKSGSFIAQFRSITNIVLGLADTRTRGH